MIFFNQTINAADNLSLKKSNIGLYGEFSLGTGFLVEEIHLKKKNELRATDNFGLLPAELDISFGLHIKRKFMFFISFFSSMVFYL